MDGAIIKMALKKFVLFLALNLFLGTVLLFGQVESDVKKSKTTFSMSSVPIVHDTITPDLTISFELTINDASVGEVDAGIWHDEAIIEKKLVAQLLIDYLRPDIYSTIFDTLFKGLTWLNAEDFATAGIAFKFDSAALTLTIIIPPEYMPIVDIDFVPEQVPNYKPILRAAPFSGFIQNESNLQVSTTADNSLFFSTRLYSMINIRKTHLFGSGYVSLSNDSFSYYLNNLYALWNNNAYKLQVSLGMVTSPGTGNQSQPLLYGISVESVEDKRYVVRQGYIDDRTEFTIRKLAKVTVEVNGRPIRQMLLAPGNYRILDLPFTTGLNEFVLRIEETDGNEQVFRRIVPRDTNIMQMGTYEFGLSAGTSTTDWSEFFASGYYLHGFSPTFSGGINLQSDKRSAMAGLTWISALPVGALNGSASMMGRWDGWGEMFAAAVSMSYLFSMSGRDYIPSLRVSANYRGAGFSAPSTSAPTSSVPDAYLSLSASMYSKIFTRTGASLGYTFTRTESSSPVMTHGLYASISQNFRGGGSTNLSGQFSVPTSGTPTFSATLAFNILLKDPYQRSLNYLQTSAGDTTVSIAETLNAFGQDFNINLNANNLLPGSGDDSSISAGFRNTSDYFDLNTTGTFNYDKNSATYSAMGYTQLRTTMAFVGPHIAFTRQIPDSFLLITAAPSMKEGTVSYSLNSGSKYTAKYNRNIVVPLTDYTTTVLSTDLLGVALNLMPRYPFVLVSPAYHSGILFQSDVIKRYMITGRLVRQDGTPIGYIPGNVYDIGGSLETSTFTDEEGRFDIYDILPGKYRIEWPEGYGVTQFELPEADNDSIDLGDMIVSIGTK